MKVGSLVERTEPFSRVHIDVAVKLGLTLPVVGGIYVVRAIFQGITLSGVEPVILLEEIVNPPHPHRDGSVREFGFAAWCFREIQPPMTINIEELISIPQTLEHATF